MIEVRPLRKRFGTLNQGTLYPALLKLEQADWLTSKWAESESGDRTHLQCRVVASLAFSFAGLTLLLASLGLYGVLSYGVTQRTRENGVRMALGARRFDVMTSVLAQSARLTVAGILLGLIVTAGAAGYLSKMLYGVTPLDPITFAVVLIVFALVTTAASYLPARRATKVDPITALRYD